MPTNLAGHPIQETSYYYPLMAIREYLKCLPQSDSYRNLVAHVDDRVLVMTHDDQFDATTVEYEKRFGISSTFFLLTPLMVSKADYLGVDVQLHFGKFYASLNRQVSEFFEKTARFPTVNRTHRLYWRSDFFDLAFLAFEGFHVDCTKVGFEPYRLCVDGKVLPIWELPVCISDQPSDGRLVSSWNPAKKIESLFRDSVSPIVVSCHSQSLLGALRMRSQFELVCELKEKYHYESLNVSQFHERYLNE